MARVIASEHKKQHKKKRPGVHSKCKNSNSKNSKHYKKKYRDRVNNLKGAYESSLFYLESF